MLPRSLLALLLLAAAAPLAQAAADGKRPNILWLTCEDSSCTIGCYGDKVAITPNLDALARKSIRYTHAFSVAGVCAPSRSCLITGMYPSTLGSHYMRCRATLPALVLCYSEHLRKAGYYCTNNVKTDYNFAVPKGAWDDVSNKAHYRNRPKDKPFFAIFNNTVTHESQIRTAPDAHKKNTARLTDKERQDPAKIVVPPFHPDTPEVRADWARVYELVTAMDKWVGQMLTELEQAGLLDDTIVFFYSDHGVGLPRGKRWLYETGMRVPLLIFFGKNFAHLAPDKPGSSTSRLVSFVDFGPTALSLAGVEIPKNMQGEPFLGRAATKPREYVYGIRDRMDERNDCTRAVRDARYRYIRNYHPYQPWAQTINYMELMPTMQSWRRLAQAGKLTGGAKNWMEPEKPFEELYDLETDPHELVNLATAEALQKDANRKTLERLRRAHLDWLTNTRDLGLMPEAEVWARSKGRTPFALGQDTKAFPQARLVQAAEVVGKKKTNDTLPALTKLLEEPDSALRWWAVTGLGVHGQGEKTALELVEKASADRSAVVRVAAGSALRRLGKTAVARQVLTKGLTDENPWVRHAAMLGLDELGEAARPALDAIRAAAKDENEYVGRVAQYTVKRLGKK